MSSSFKNNQDLSIVIGVSSDTIGFFNVLSQGKTHIGVVYQKIRGSNRNDAEKTWRIASQNYKGGEGTEHDTWIYYRKA